MSKKTCATVISDVDANGSGAIEFDEFIVMMTAANGGFSDPDVAESDDAECEPAGDAAPFAVRALLLIATDGYIS